MTPEPMSATNLQGPVRVVPEVPSRADALRVGRAILDAHGQWEKENIHQGAQQPWGEQHVILLGQAAMLAAPPPARMPTREEAIEIIDGHPAFMAEVMDENRIWLAGLLYDALFSPPSADPVVGEEGHE